MSEESNPQQISSKSSGERLNFIIAVCAILISAASFYATYLQADAANKQVKAMTLPMIQYGHGNAMGTGDRTINFSLKNAGVGPALIKWVEFTYQGQSYANVFQLLHDCCESVVKPFFTPARQAANDLPQFITSPLVNTIIPGQDTHVFLQFEYAEETQVLWQLLNDIRFEFGFNACYCSMLDQCYTVNDQSAIKAVASCPQ